MFSIKQKQNNWPTVVALVCLVSFNVLLLFGFLLKYTNQCFKKTWRDLMLIVVKLTSKSQDICFSFNVG